MYTQISQSHQIPSPEEPTNFWNGPVPSTQPNIKFPPPIKQEYVSHHPPPPHHHHHHHHHHDMNRSTQELGN
jgi:hypothetical protein